MKALMIASLLLFLAARVSGQERFKVELNNGSVIQGKLISETDSTVSIQTKDNNVWSFNRVEIKSLEPAKPPFSESGYRFRPSFGVAAGENSSASLHIVNAYQFNERWDAGIGVGIENLWDVYIPIFLEGRYYITTTLNQPFLQAMAGYEMPLNNWEFDKGGFTTGAGLGFQHTFGNQFSFSTQLGYRFAYLKRRDWWWDDAIIVNQINRIELKFVFNFR